jgi:two-component system, sensor histidine kinase and response regulator
MIVESKNILVIDDQIDNFDIIEDLLDNENYQCYYASGGMKAFSLLEKINPDVILLDVMMPEMDGLEVCQRLKSNPKYRHIPIIMVTALNSKKDLVRCLEQGADDFLSKPIDSLELRARIRCHLRIKQQYDELQELVNLREETLTMREDMSNMIVHDLRNPLSAMILATGIVQKYIDRVDQKPLILKTLNKIQISGRQIDEMIDSLLLMAKLESGKIILNPVPTDLYELGMDVIKDFELIANSRQIELQSELPNIGESILVDATILRRVIDNLISNALKFSSPKGQITLSLEYLPENHLKIKVADTGAGITDEEKRQIFGKFEVGSLKKNTSQTGLGLAFCKMAVAAQGGTIAIADNHPQGVIFIIEI